MRFNFLKAAEPLQGSSLFFTAKFPDIPDAHLINLRRMKGWIDDTPGLKSSAYMYDWAINIY